MYSAIWRAMLSRFFLFAFGILLGAPTSALQAEPFMGWFARKVEADPNATYELKEEHGPWMIMATSFSGEGAEEQAKALVLELRKRFKVKAYMFDQLFDHTEKMQGSRIDRFGKPVELRYRRGGKYKEIAVLAGEFPAVDDPSAQALLKQLKYADIHCMRLEPGKPDHQNLGALRAIQQEINRMAGGEHAQKAQLGRLGKAFIVTNPMLPKDFFKIQGLDPLVAQMNRPVEHSLLKATGNYTVQIATFTGKVVIKPDEIKKIEAGGQLESRLAQAAQSAHKVTEALRSRGVEAYEFHDRYQSIVCVGSFNTYGSPRQDGKIEINPQIHSVMREYGVNPDEIKNNPRASQPKVVAGHTLDVQPQIVKIPKESVTTGFRNPIWNPFRR